jgi:putative membrane protein
MMGYGVAGGGAGWIWMIGGLAVMVGLVVLIVWAVSRANHAGSVQDPARPAPIDILRERLARGEITPEEFEQAKKALGS